VLRPIRRLLPDTGAIDFSPMVLVFILMALERILESARPY
jgi:YggT family protein